MTDNTQPEAMRLAQELDEAPETGADPELIQECAAVLRRQQARIAELEAQLEAIGAGGVNGPLIGQPQAMPDLTALTERGAKAWTAVDAQALREGRWYMVTHDGVATLCEDRRDAEEEAKDADMAWPHSGPHRAVQLVEAADAQQENFDHGPQATSIEEAARDVGKWLNERPNRPIDLRHVAMLCAHAHAAQDAQEPVAWYVTGGSRLLDEDEAKAEARHIGGTARAMPLYTAPQPSTTAQESRK